MNRTGQVKIVGGKLRLSSNCPPEKLSSLAYFQYCNVSFSAFIKVQG